MRWLVVALLLMIFAALGFVPGQKIYDDGLWPLTVTVRSKAGQPIKGISAEAFLDVDSAREMLADPPPLALTRAENSVYAAVQEPKVDEPLKVTVPTSETRHCA